MLNAVVRIRTYFIACLMFCQCFSSIVSASVLQTFKTHAQKIVTQAIQNTKNEEDLKFLQVFSQTLELTKFETFYECNTYDAQARGKTLAWAKVNVEDGSVSGSPNAKISKTMLNTEPEIFSIETILHETAHIMGVHSELLAELTAQRILKRAGHQITSLLISSEEHLEILEKRWRYQKNRGCFADAKENKNLLASLSRPENIKDNSAEYFGNYPELQFPDNVTLSIVVTDNTTDRIAYGIYTTAAEEYSGSMDRYRNAAKNLVGHFFLRFNP
jgi:hypothetical protein